SQNLPTRPPGRERPPSRPPAGVSPRKGAFANAGLGGGKAPTRHLVKTCRKLVPNHRDEASVEMSRTPSRRRRRGMVAPWEAVLTELVRSRGAALARYATLLCGNASDGEDLVQDALTKVFSRFRRSHSEEGPEYAEAYVRRAIVTLYLDSYRRGRRWRAVQHLFEPAQVHHDESTSARVDVARALTTLPPRQRACVVLRYYADLTIEQTGDELGLATG